MFGLNINKIDKKEIDNFYQSKYEYYRIMSICTVLISVLASNAYWISDCQLFGRPAMETLIPRLFMLIPLIFYMITAKRVRNYKVMVFFSYLILHGIMWCTIWAIYYLPIKIHANEGFIIMHMMFIGIGFCAPRKWSALFHSLLIVDILVSYPINHYESIDLMLSLGIPVLVAVEALLYFMENNYVEQYLTAKKLERMTMHDALTDAYSRNKMQDLCIKDSCILKCGNAAVMIVDVDFFKKVNDTYGHDIGDVVLKNLVGIINSCISENDIVIRWGGEEFVIISPVYDESKIKKMPEKLRRQVENHHDSMYGTTVSIGVALYNGGDYHAVVKKADEALYYAKEHGRNQVVLRSEIA